MNYKNKNNYKVISETDYKKLSYDMRISYNPTESVISHGFEGDVLTSLSMMAIGSILFDDSNSFSPSYDSRLLEVSSFDNFGGGGAGGEW